MGDRSSSMRGTLVPIHRAGDCACGHEDGVPRLDLRPLPHVVRHATVFGAMGVIPPDGSLEIVAQHDPRPLLDQLREREQGLLGVEYLQSGPDTWVLRLNRLPGG